MGGRRLAFPRLRQFAPFPEELLSLSYAQHRSSPDISPAPGPIVRGTRRPCAEPARTALRVAVSVRGARALHDRRRVPRALHDRVGPRAHLSDGPAGREQVLHVEGPGRTVAELPLFDGGPYPASAVTIEDVAARVPAARRLRISLSNAARHRAGDHSRARTAPRHLVHLTETLAFRDVAARLAMLLVGYAERAGTSRPHQASRSSSTARRRRSRTRSARRANRSPAR